MRCGRRNQFSRIRLVNRPAAGRDEFEQILFGIPKVKTAAAARPIDYTFDRNSALFETPAPVRFGGGGNGEGGVLMPPPIVWRDDAAGGGNGIKSGPFDK